MDIKAPLKIKPLNIDRNETERFVEALTGFSVSTAILDWATFADDKKTAEAPTFRIRGTLAEVWDRLVEANQQGSGVFVTINESNGRSFLDCDITGMRSVFVDDDGADPPVTHTVLSNWLAPSITVKSKHGEHNYWLVRMGPGEDITDFTPMQKALAKKLGTDKKISNPGRVMRLPGFLHKRDSEPYMVRITQIEDVEYTLREIIDAFEIPIPNPKSKTRVVGKPTTETERVKRARAYISKIGPAISGQGGDQTTFKVASVLVRDFDLDDERAMPLFLEWNATCLPPWDEDELWTKLSNARAYGKADFGNKVVDDSVFKEALFRGAQKKTDDPSDEDLGYRPSRPFWTSDQFAADRGPLVHYVPSGKQGDEGETQWTQTQPTGQMVANAAEALVYYCNTAVFSYPGIGNQYYSISPKNIATQTTRELLMPDVRELCQAMMAGLAPTPETFSTGEQHIRAMPQKGTDLPLTRWAGQKHVALHELPLPQEGDWSAHKEFVQRCSCPDTLMMWTWSCFLPEDQTGREALLIFGNGNDGKSQWCQKLMEFLGPVSAASEILRGENRFELASLLNKRLVYFGDFRNPRPIHSKIMREVIAGAYIYMEGKGKDGKSAYFHPRCLLSTNVEPRISMSDRAEYTRVRRINVKELDDNKGDRAWPKKLLEQMPAFLFECKKVYERMVTEGRDLPITEACKEALRGGEEAMAEDFDFLTEYLEVTKKETDYITSKNLIELMNRANYKEWVRKDAYRWLRSLGAYNKGPDGKDLFRTEMGKQRRVWCGVRELSTGPLRHI